MKYGLIYYRNTGNLGDDILSYAGKQFYPHVDYYIDRESLDVFTPDKREYVAAIMNGWYLHRNYTFQPFPYLFPLFIGTHFSRDQMIQNDWSYIDASVVRYLNQYGPVGCRDKHTADLLAQKQVASYFSGCLTMTLPRFSDVAPNNQTILVDVPDEVAAYVRRLLPSNDIVEKTHRLTEGEIGGEWPEREERLIQYLKLYQGADLVITTRLHCALPCLALGTPVVFIASYNEDYRIRIESFAEYLPHYSVEDILAHRADEALLHPVQGGSVDILVSKMRADCQEFIRRTQEEEQDISPLPEPSFYRSIYVDRTQYMRYAIHVLCGRNWEYLKQIRLDGENMKRTVTLCQSLLEENDRLKQQLAGLSGEVMEREGGRFKNDRTGG